MKGFFKSILVVFFLLPFVFFGQEEKGYYKWFDQVIGHDHLALHCGTQYIDRETGRVYKGEHAFFKSDKSLLGTIYYDGQVYYDFHMKYNLETDKLLIEVKGTSLSVLQLVSSKIEKFTIEGNNFIKIDRQIDDRRINGFYELLLEKESFQLLKKHTATRIGRIDNVAGKNKLLVKFRKKSWHILNTKEGFLDIKSKVDIGRVYPHLRKEIKSFYREYQVLRNEEPDAFMKKLFYIIIQPSVLENEL
ncbi:hypothetical protein ABW636_07020 [Aquimarina sp. 2201CG1-2-11]|uniref:hypothetical protein n=1 Tax=Aquimarina discodermiae TaxID=3231043 RepID=UPI003463477F